MQTNEGLAPVREPGLLVRIDLVRLPDAAMFQRSAEDHCVAW